MSWFQERLDSKFIELAGSSLGLNHSENVWIWGWMKQRLCDSISTRLPHAPAGDYLTEDPEGRQHPLPEGPGQPHPQEAGECHQEGWQHHKEL